MPKLEPPPMELRATVQNNPKVLAARLRAIATLVLQGKKTQAWHALIALADKIDPDKK